MSQPSGMFFCAQEVRHQALRLADRQPRHPRTVPPEEELVRTHGAGTSGSCAAREGPAMPDAPLAPVGTPLRLRRLDGERFARPGFFPPQHPEHETHLAGIITGSDRLYYLGPDATRDALHVAGSSLDLDAQGSRIVYFAPGEAELLEGDEH
jgi:hypothetical protein